MNKLGARDRAQLVGYAYQAGITPGPGLKPAPREGRTPKPLRWSIAPIRLESLKNLHVRI